jgi:glycosyltransferase involved in cell wall biosynthesis
MTKRVLIVAPNPSTFVIRDVGLLTEEFSVGFIRNPAQLRMSSILGMIMMPCAIIRSDIVITWFADYSKLVVRMARLFGKKSIVMIAGYDVAKVDSIGYGALISKRKKKMVEWSLEHTDQVIAVDSGLVEDLVTHFGRDFGAEVVHTGYNDRKYHPEGVKKELVLSVCGAVDHRGLVKGIDVFAECARRMPDVSFRIIGVKGDRKSTRLNSSH